MKIGELIYAGCGNENRNRSERAFAADAMSYLGTIEARSVLFNDGKRHPLVYIAVLTHDFHRVVGTGEFNFWRFLIAHNYLCPLK